MEYSDLLERVAGRENTGNVVNQDLTSHRRFSRSERNEQVETKRVLCNVDFSFWEFRLLLGSERGLCPRTPQDLTF